MIIPPLLDELLANGRWSRNEAESLRQNLRPLTSADRVRALAPEETSIYLFPPPFHTVRTRVRNGDQFWLDRHAAPGEIDFDLALDIGDFGLGSDAPILLDYRESLKSPRVIRLRWLEPKTDNHWVLMAESFEQFVERLGL